MRYGDDYTTMLFLNNTRVPTKDELRGTAKVLEAVGIIDAITYASMLKSIDALVEDWNEGYIFTQQQKEFGFPIEIPYEIKHKGAFPFFSSRNDALDRFPDGMQALELFPHSQSVDPYTNRYATRLIIAVANEQGAEQEALDANPIITELRRRLANVFDISEKDIVIRTC
jgi:hypothetical protein